MERTWQYETLARDETVHERMVGSLVDRNP
jgi:hypothetical protein